ncbi:MAG: allantoate amidohydrolase [Actinobacteria bacterium]|nr:allantoate amidohydrolase [Actinomycetota bacterium]
MSFDRLWSDIEPIGRVSSGGYRRFAWTREDHDLREWFAGQAQARGLDLVLDRAGNQWAWWGDADSTPGLVIGSHLDSVPDGGAYDGPLGVVSAFAALDDLRAAGFTPTTPLGIVNFGDEEGARFGIACAGSRIMTGALSPDRARALTDGDGTSLAEAAQAGGIDASHLGRDDVALARVGCFVELHVEQGMGLAELGRSVAVADSIWPHGRWRIELPGEANHAGTTRLADRNDPTLAYARVLLAAREAATRHGAVATCGKVRIDPNGVNAIPSLVTAWLDSRGPKEAAVRDVVAELSALAAESGGSVREESWTPRTSFDPQLRDRLVRALGYAPVLATGAGHDAGILANAGVPTAMLFVRNPSGVSHSPAEFAERDDCLAGVDALSAVVRELAG